jgi:hypothetical protein
MAAAREGTGPVPASSTTPCLRTKAIAPRAFKKPAAAPEPRHGRAPEPHQHAAEREEPPAQRGSCLENTFTPPGPKE